MHWTMEMLEHMLRLYKSKKVLWDPRHPKHHNKAAREAKLQWIADQLEVPNLTGADVGRKLRTMRAAYQVELRNINAGKARGFFYKPTLKWFQTYKTCMDEIEGMKYKFDDLQDSDELSLEEEENNPNTYLLKISNRYKREAPEEKEFRTSKKQKKSVTGFNAELYAEMTQEMNSPFKEVVPDSDDSNDEFQLFADHIAEQLRLLPNLSRALLLENQIIGLFQKDRSLYTMPD